MVFCLRQHRATFEKETIGLSSFFHEGSMGVHMNEHSDFIFSDDMGEATKKFPSDVVGKDSIAEYTFSRSVHNQKVTKEKGATAIRYCPLTI